jgi:tetratricopeptide (TPR) repeat protein
MHAYNNLGLICDAKNEHDKALSYYDQALAIDPHAVNVHFNRAICCLSLGMYKEARNDFFLELAVSPASVATEYYYKAVDSFLSGRSADSRDFIARLEAMKHIIPTRFTEDLRKTAQIQ